MKLALKVDVDTLAGTTSGVPELLRLFDKHGVRATFLFSLGPDHTGRAVRRIFRPGFLDKVRRTSVPAHYGWKTLLYGTLLPGPDIGHRAAGIMRSVAQAGHETGVHAFDHCLWQDGAAGADEAWTRRQLELACDRFFEIFGRLPAVHGAAGWQMNRFAFDAEVEAGFRYASDTRGRSPFRPVVNDRPIACLQVPTTLPTLDEIIGCEDPVEALQCATLRCPDSGHVFTLHAELEGGLLRDTFDELLTGWRGQGYALGALEESVAGLDVARIPRCTTAYAPMPGRPGRLTVQGEELPA